jgi:hypothetical protein
MSSSATRQPFNTPKPRPTASAAAKRERRRAGGDDRHGERDRGEGEHRAHREIEALGHDDQRHRQREQQQDGRLDQDVLCIRQRGEVRICHGENGDQQHQRDRDPGHAQDHAGGRGSLVHPQAHDIGLGQLVARASSPTIRPARIT